MPKNYEETDWCAREMCSAADHYIKARKGLVVWRGSNGVYFGPRTEEGHMVGIDRKMQLVLSTKEFHALLEDDAFILRVLLALEET